VNQVNYSPISSSKLVLSLLALALAIFAVAPDSFAQATHRVPQDFPTIQSAVNAANAGDTIRVGPGRWCGARITKTLNLVGEGATIMGCPAGVPGPVGNIIRRGFFLNVAASGSSIRNFIFDGKGVSDTNSNPLSLGIQPQFGTNNVTIDSNSFLGGLGGIQGPSGNDWMVTHNVFDGYTMLSDGVGGFGILSEDFQAGPFTGNVFVYNVFTAVVPPGNFSFASYITEVDVPFVGIAIAGHNGTIIANNKIAIASNTSGDAGVGIVATDSSADGLSSTDDNLVVANNDGRGSQYGLIITKDQFGGTANTAGATIRGNFGVNLINSSTSNVNNRSLHTLLECDSSGVCQ
jgi:serine protease